MNFKKSYEYELLPPLEIFIFGNHSDRVIVNYLAALTCFQGVAVRGFPGSGKKKTIEAISSLLGRPCF